MKSESLVPDTVTLQLKTQHIIFTCVNKFAKEYYPSNKINFTLDSISAVPS